MKFIEITPGKSVKGQDIKAYKSEVDGPKYNYVLGAVHGDEIEGAHLAINLHKWLAEQSTYNSPTIFVPVVNIDGYNANSRVNGNGVDLNRNLPSSQWSPEAREAKYFPGTHPLSEPENQFLVNLFEKYPPRFVLSFHSCYPVLNYNGKCREVAEFLKKYNNYAIEADFENHPTPGSLGEFGPQKFNTPVLTFECPLVSEGATLDGIWKDNFEGLTKLFSTNFINEFKE
jgi:protein MpaA